MIFWVICKISKEQVIIRSLFYIGLSILCLFPSLLAIFYAPIDPDSSYYLSIVERIHDGYIPYKTVSLGYTPLVFYLMVLFKKAFSIGINYEFYLTIHFFMQFVCAFFIYKISLELIKRADYAFYGSALFILASHWNIGNSFLLETPSIMFGLIAVYLAIRNSDKKFFYFWIGLAVSFSFLSKQFGLGFLGLVIFLIIFNKEKWTQLLYLSLGFIVPISICALIWDFDFIPILTGNGYNSIGEHYGKGNFEMLFNRILYFFKRIYPVILPGIFLIPFFYKKLNTNERVYFLLLFLGIIGFLLQFFFAPFSHYFLYIIPFASILSFYLLEKITKCRWIYSSLLLITFGLSIYSTYYNRVYKIYFKNQTIKSSQYLLAQEITKIIQENNTLYIADIGLVYLYYLTNKLPPNLGTIGYSFGAGLNKQTHLKQIKSADYILKFAKEYNDFSLNSEESIEALKNREQIHINKDVILYY